MSQVDGLTGLVLVDAQTLVATLVLHANAGGPLNLNVAQIFDTISGSGAGSAVVPAVGANFLNGTVQAVVPEPGTLPLLSSGLGGLLFLGRRSKN